MRLPKVIEQVASIAAKLKEWGWADDISRDELDHATIAYNSVCVEYECCEWLPFDVVPNWEDDLYCVLMDEDFWREKRTENLMGYDIAKMIRSRETEVMKYLDGLKKYEIENKDC